MNIFDFDDYRSWLRKEAEIKILKNPNFSLRAFAKKIKVSQSMLSLILNGKRNLTLQRMTPICEFLNLTMLEQRYFKLLLQYEAASTTQERNAIKRERDELKKNAFTMTKVTEGRRPFSAWHYNLILAATDLRHIARTRDGLADHLGFSKDVISPALDLLCQLELVKEVNGEFIANHKALEKLPDSIVMQSSWKICHTILEKALTHFEDNRLEVDTIAGRIIATNPAQIKIANEKIILFMKDLEKTLQQGDPTMLVQYSLQLFEA